ncbi:hypothetical protein BGX24_007177 [Mortierella sp. AD032]|nr:hypothetical protein BGX24_007177 [Mortierella sp. AD032]
MSSFPKHSFEQAYDHAFPPSPPNGHNVSTTPSRPTSSSQGHSTNNNNSLTAPGLSTISERSPLITKAPIQNHPGSYTSINNNNNNEQDEDDYHPNNNHHSHGTSVSSTDTLLEQGNSSSSGQYMSIQELTAREFKILLRYSGPIVLTYVLQNSLQLASLVSLGHLGSIELAASSLASMFAAVTCWSVSLGTATALDTLCSQSYTSHHPHTLGLHLQRAILVLMLLFVPIAGVWLSSEYIFTLLGQEEALAQHAALFLRGLLPGAPAFLIFECVKKYLQAQGNMHASTYVLLIASPINVILNYILVWDKHIGMGYIGAPIATSISYWNMLILLLLYIRFVDGYQGWGGWSRECLTGWPAFMKLALPGVMMVCTEWWAFEVVSLAASYLGTVALAAQSVVVQTSGLLFTVPFGVSIAASNRVGNLIGLGDARSAKVAARVSIAMSIMFGMINSTMLIVFKDRWGRLFSEDAEVVATVAMVLPLVALFQISDGLAGVGGGVLRGVGLQHLGAYLNVIAYYLVAFPVGYLLAFKLMWGLKGLWSALCVALWMVGLGELYVIFKTDWQAEVIKCKVRNDELAKRTGEDEE